MELELQSSKHTVDYGNAEEKVVSLFEPDMLLSAQYMENLCCKTPVEPEKKLMLAVLEDAIYSFQANVMAERGRPKKLFNETVDWFMDQNDDWLFSFESVCEILRLHPDYVRRGLLRWKDKKLARPAAYSSGKKMMVGYGLAANDHS